GINALSAASTPLCRGLAPDAASSGRSLGGGLAEPRLERGEPLLERFLRDPRLRGHRFHRVELLAPDKIHAAEDALELVAQPRFDLAPHPGQSSESAGRDAREIVDETVLSLHILVLGKAPGAPSTAPRRGERFLVTPDRLRL